MTAFPKNFGELACKTFEEVFESNPKWIEYVLECWTDNCTGLFLEFQQFIKKKIEDKTKLQEHRNRCKAYVKKQKKEDLPDYLWKYL